MSAADALARGVAFVEASGDHSAIARARALAAGRPPDDPCLPDGVTQRADGSLEAGDGCAIESGAMESRGFESRGFESRGFESDWELLQRVLGAAADLRALHLPAIERVCSFLEGVQADDGSWGARDESPEQKIVRTGMLAGHLGKTRFARAATLAGAGDYIADRFTPDLVQGFNWPAIAAYANYFANVPHDESDAVLQWIGRELERGFRSGRFDGVQTARVLLYAEAPSLPGGRVDAVEAIERLLSEQQGDGGWLRFDDPAPSARLDHTLDALTALVRLC